jgi:hypothetical protein
VGWRALRRHQDWDFVLRCTDRHDVHLVQIAEPLVAVHVSGSGISAASDWVASLDWYREAGARWDDRVRADFLAGQPLRYAIEARSRDGVRAVLAELGAVGLPSVRACSLALAGGLGRRRTVQLMHRRSLWRGPA